MIIDTMISYRINTITIHADFAELYLSTYLEFKHSETTVLVHPSVLKDLKIGDVIQMSIQVGRK